MGSLLSLRTRKGFTIPGLPRCMRMRLLPITLMTSLLWAQMPDHPARIKVFEASSKRVNAGDIVELRWAAMDADNVRLDPPGQDFPSVGKMAYMPKGRTVFWLFASNLRGGQSIPLIVEVIPPKTPVVPVPPRRREIPKAAPHPLGPGGIWIQFAACETLPRAQDLQKTLSRLLGKEIKLFEIKDPEHPGQTLHRVRVGPFPSFKEARKILREIQPQVRPMGLKPIVADD